LSNIAVFAGNVHGLLPAAQTGPLPSSLLSHLRSADASTILQTVSLATARG
jgi:hypothetical protein